MPLNPQTQPRVKLIAAVMASREELIREALSALSPSYGPVELASEVFPFKYSTYYAAEMGEGLVKAFFSFRGLMEPTEVVARKLEAMACEDRFLAEDARSRRVNVDPGYIDQMKLVLATTKNAAHRVYVGSGVYGDVELAYESGAFVPLERTYADYREPLALEFFRRVRRDYLAELRQ